MDYDCNYHALENLFADRGKWAQVQEPHSEGRAMYQGMIAGLEDFSQSFSVELDFCAHDAPDQFRRNFYRGENHL